MRTTYGRVQSALSAVLSYGQSPLPLVTRDRSSSQGLDRSVRATGSLAAILERVRQRLVTLVGRLASWLRSRTVPTSVDLPGDALVVRFSPTSAERVLRKAELLSRDSGGAHLVSVFVGVSGPDETQDAVLVRVLRATETDFDPVKNRNFFVCARADTLVDRGFSFVKDGYAGEIAEHYSVDLGFSPTLADVERFLGAFERRKRR